MKNKKIFVTLIAVVIGLLMSACSTPHPLMVWTPGQDAREHARPAKPVESPTLPKQADVTDLPVADYQALISGASQLVNPHLLGFIATSNRTNVVAYGAPAGHPIAHLAAGVPLPVFGSEAGYVQLLLPSRIGLPSSGGQVNGGAAWVQESDLTFEAVDHYLHVDLDADRLTVVDIDQARDVVTFPLAHSPVVPTGPTFVAESTVRQGQCHETEALTLAAQGEIQDGFNGQGTNPVALLGLGHDCVADLAYGKEIPYASIPMDPADLQLVRAVVDPGTAVYVTGSVDMTPPQPRVLLASASPTRL